MKTLNQGFSAAGAIGSPRGPRRPQNIKHGVQEQDLLMVINHFRPADSGSHYGYGQNSLLLNGGPTHGVESF